MLSPCRYIAITRTKSLVIITRSTPNEACFFSLATFPSMKKCKLDPEEHIHICHLRHIDTCLEWIFCYNCCSTQLDMRWPVVNFARERTMFVTDDTGCCQYYFVVACGIGGCYYDSLRCHQWRQCWHHDNSRVPLQLNNDMMTSSNGNIFRVTGHLCDEFTGPRWITRTKASDAELSCFLWSAPE